jgi:hypothetical protein
MKARAVAAPTAAWEAAAIEPGEPYGAGELIGFPFSTICTVLNDMHGEILDSASRAIIVWSARRNLHRVSGLKVLVRCAIDFEDCFPFEDIGVGGAGMGMAANACARGDFGKCHHSLVAGRKVNCPKRCPLGALLS